MSALPYFTDEEVANMCEGLTQPAAMARYLRKRYGLRVDRKPNGKPLAWKPEASAPQAQNESPGLNVLGLQEWAAGRNGGKQREQKAQGR